MIATAAFLSVCFVVWRIYDLWCPHCHGFRHWYMWSKDGPWECGDCGKARGC